LRSHKEQHHYGEQSCGSGFARIQNFLQDPNPELEVDTELEVMDTDPELDFTLQFSQKCKTHAKMVLFSQNFTKFRFTKIFRFCEKIRESHRENEKSDL
jgi:hypothetical protein